MALNKTVRPTRITFGNDGLVGKRNIVSATFVSCDLKKAVNGTANALRGSMPGDSTQATVHNVTAALDVPRNVVLTAAGTTGNISSATVTVTGKNVEGATITENFTPSAGVGGTYTGNKAFASVSRVDIGQQTGAGTIFQLGLGNKLGIGSRNLSSSDVRLYKKIANGTETLVVPAATAYSSTVVESNTVTPDVAPNGTTQYVVYVLNYNWHLNPINGNSDYGV